MGSKKRGRERLVNCDSCGSRVPRDKAVTLFRTSVYSTDLRTADDVRTSISREFHYCPSCGKHKRIYEKKKRQAAAAKERREAFGGLRGGYASGGGYRHNNPYGQGSQSQAQGSGQKQEGQGTQQQQGVQPESQSKQEDSNQEAQGQ
ncbi:hypothetical protein FJZ26_01255 [Candidatus Parvarchaeota archaeon]|nr:hypothetical protein [Candidatus Parvarchaeota archaeon]